MLRYLDSYLEVNQVPEVGYYYFFKYYFKQWSDIQIDIYKWEYLLS